MASPPELFKLKIASITETKNNLSALIDGLRAGAPVLIVDRDDGSRVEPVDGREHGGPDGRLRVVRDGSFGRAGASARGCFQRFSAARRWAGRRSAHQRTAGRR